MFKWKFLHWVIFLPASCPLLFTWFPPVLKNTLQVPAHLSLSRTLQARDICISRAYHVFSLLKPFCDMLFFEKKVCIFHIPPAISVMPIISKYLITLVTLYYLRIFFDEILFFQMIILILWFSFILWQKSSWKFSWCQAQLILFLQPQWCWWNESSSMYWQSHSSYVAEMLCSLIYVTSISKLLFYARLFPLRIKLIFWVYFIEQI